MAYRLYESRIKTIKKRVTSVTAALVLAATSLSSAAPLFLSQKAFAIPVGTVNISNVADLCNAIQNQADNQTWTINNTGVAYGLTQCNSINAGGQTGWYFPITANNITITGINNPTIYGKGFTPNGNWASQDLIAIFGNNVTLNGLTLMPKVEPNKTIEVIGGSTTIENVTITPNTLTDQSEYNNISDPSDPAWTQYAKTWGGSIYYNNATGIQTLDNVSINNGGVSVHAPSTTLNVSSLQLLYTSNIDWINDYRFYNSSNSVIHGTPTYTYHVNAMLNNFKSVLAAVGDPTTVLGTDTISLDSDISTNTQVTLAKPVTLNGNGYTISPTFPKTNNSNNSALGIQANNVTVNNLVEDGASGTNLHGINVFNASSVNLNGVTVKNNDYSGLNVDGSKVTVNNLTTASNGWDGVDVDKTGAVLTVNGISHHTETTPDIYVDNASVGQVVDTNNQYSITHPVIQANDSAYNLKPAAPTLSYPANNSLINTNDFWFTWGNVPGAVSYEFQASQSTSVDGNGSLNSGVWIGDYQGKQPTAPTAHSVGANGTWYWQVRAVDVKGAKSDWSSVWKLTIDMTAPTGLANVSPKSGIVVTTANQKLIDWTDATDANGPVTYYYESSHSSSTKLDGSFTTPAYGPVSTGSNSYIASSGTPEGIWYWHVRAKDAAGNYTAWTTPWEIIVDNTAPVVSITSPSDGDVVRGTVVVSGTVSDSNPDHYYFVVKDSLGHVVAGPGVVNQANVSPWNWNTAKIADGTYTIDLEARDAAGNKGVASVKTISVTVDNTAPVVTDTDNFNVSMLTGDKKVLSPTVTGETGKVTYKWNVSLFDSQILNNPKDTLDGTTLEIGPAPKGTYTVNLTVTDQAGNQTTVPYSIVISDHANSTVASAVLGASTGNDSSSKKTSTATTGGTVLGTETTTPTESTSPATDTGKVKGASTDTVNLTTNKSDTINHSRFLGLGWWWLAVLAALLGFFWFLLGKRDERSDK